MEGERKGVMEGVMKGVMYGGMEGVIEGVTEGGMEGAEKEVRRVSVLRACGAARRGGHPLAELIVNRYLTNGRLMSPPSS